MGKMKKLFRYENEQEAKDISQEIFVKVYKIGRAHV